MIDRFRRRLAHSRARSRAHALTRAHTYSRTARGCTRTSRTCALTRARSHALTRTHARPGAASTHEPHVRSDTYPPPFWRASRPPGAVPAGTPDQGLGRGRVGCPPPDFVSIPAILPRLPRKRPIYQPNPKPQIYQKGEGTGGGKQTVALLSMCLSCLAAAQRIDIRNDALCPQE